MIIKPLFYEYLSDSTLYDDKIMNSQLLIGKDLMVAPVLYPNTEFVLSYFPLDTW